MARNINAHFTFHEYFSSIYYNYGQYYCQYSILLSIFHNIGKVSTRYQIHRDIGTIVNKIDRVRGLLGIKFGGLLTLIKSDIF